jgi:hypothetical protein
MKGQRLKTKGQIMNMIEIYLAEISPGSLLAEAPAATIPAVGDLLSIDNKAVRVLARDFKLTRGGLVPRVAVESPGGLEGAVRRAMDESDDCQPSQPLTGEQLYAQAGLAGDPPPAKLPIINYFPDPSKVPDPPEWFGNAGG